MKKNLVLMLITVLLTAAAVLSGCTSLHGEPELEPGNTWVVLVEQNHYPAGYSDLEIDFLNSRQLNDLFITAGVPEQNILIIRDEVGEAEIRESMEWLSANASNDATIFYYIGAHGSYIRKRLRWNVLTPPQWNALPQKNKVLVVDSCWAGEFIAPFEDEKRSGITYAIVGADELNWWGEESEGLPVNGSIWVHFFVEAFGNTSADLNADGALSFLEAHRYTNAAVQKYTKDFIIAHDDYRQPYLSHGYDPASGAGYPNAVMNNNHAGGLILHRYSRGN